MPFRDRSEAGRRLTKALAAYKLEKPVILTLPRGGVHHSTCGGLGDRVQSDLCG